MPERIQIELSEEVQAAQRANICCAVALLNEGKVKLFEEDQMPQGPLHIIGGGHSVKETIHQADGDLCAVNGAHDWLIDRNIIPDYALFNDWTDIVARRLTPHKFVTYLPCSTCHPLMFEKLQGFDCQMWHSGASEGLVAPGTRFYGGGPNAVQRVIPVLYDRGYREFHFHGVDACWGETSHIYEWENRGIEGEKAIEVTYAGRTFKTRIDWLCQAHSFEEFLEIYRNWEREGRMDPITIRVHGDGLIPHIARIKGCHVDGVQGEKHE